MKIEITIPENWSEVKLKTYQDYMKAIKPYEGTDEYTQIALEKAVNHFCNLSTEELYKLPVENYQGILGYMSELITEGHTSPSIKKFVIGSTKYGFIPSLDQMTYGEYIDLSTYFKEMWSNIATIMTILYRPITEEKGETYSIEPYNGTNEDTEALFTHAITMDIVWGAISFFLNLQKDLLSGMVTYSIKSLKGKMEINSQLLETLITSGEDISRLQSLPTTISRSLKK